MPALRLKRKDLLEFILDFYNRYNIVPGHGFLAGYYKTSIQVICRKLDELEEQGKIERISTGTRKTTYKII